MKDIVDVAIGEIGYREQGNNRTKYGEYNRSEWCCMVPFVCFLVCT